MSAALPLRLAELSDAPAIARLINSAFQVERFFIDSDRITVEEVCDRLGTGRFLLSEDEDVLAGCIYVETRGERGYLGLLSVDPARQRTGLGAHLMQAAEKHCRENGCRFADLLIVNLRTELPPFYRRLGYVENGTELFPAEVQTKAQCHFIRMTKPLGGEQHQPASVTP